MSSLHAQNIDKPVDPQSVDSLAHPDTGAPHAPDHVADALDAAVDASAEHADVQAGIHAPMHKVPGSQHGWVSKFVPGLEKLASKYHVGNFVKIRGSDETFFESMPIYPRLGMHLLYYGGEQEKLLQNKSVEAVLRDLSVKQGRVYDSPESVKSIPSFIKTYSIQTEELRQPDISTYKTFNEFFYRQLREDARPVQHADVPGGFCSAADSRLTVYSSVDLAKQFWVKGSHFSIPALLGVAPDSAKAKQFENGSLAIFRLAPADYHRYHSPLDGTIGEVVDIPGQYYTVNPQAVNEPGFDVFTANKRSVLTIKHTTPAGRDVDVALVAIGAMLVGSIVWTGGRTPGQPIARGQELGYFAYGGSTVIAVFPPGVCELDADLLAASEKEQPVETLVKVGYSLGRPVAA